MHSIIDTYTGEEVVDLNGLTAAFVDGDPVLFTTDAGERLIFQFPAKPRPNQAVVLVHDMNAQDLDQVIDHIEGDTHDRSKLSYYDGENIYRLF